MCFQFGGHSYKLILKLCELFHLVSEGIIMVYRQLYLFDKLFYKKYFYFKVHKIRVLFVKEWRSEKWINDLFYGNWTVLI